MHDYINEAANTDVCLAMQINFASPDDRDDPNHLDGLQGRPA